MQMSKQHLKKKTHHLLTFRVDGSVQSAQAAINYDYRVANHFHAPPGSWGDSRILIVASRPFLAWSVQLPRSPDCDTLTDSQKTVMASTEPLQLIPTNLWPRKQRDCIYQNFQNRLLAAMEIESGHSRLSRRLDPRKEVQKALPSCFLTETLTIGPQCTQI